MDLELEKDEFFTRYSYMCLKAKVCPLKSVIKHLKGTQLSCPVEAVRKEHWPFLLAALSGDNSLTRVHFSTALLPLEELCDLWRREKRRYPFPYGIQPTNISAICRSISQLLPASDALKVLQLENLHLTKEDANNLTEGLRVSNIQRFSVAGCQMEDEVVQIICRGLYTSDAEWADFSSCGLSLAGLKAVCNVIETHKHRRKLELFPKTLRQRMPLLEDMKGLRRVSLIDNVIGLEGIKIILASLEDDLWLKALDLQMCSIDDQAAKLVLDALSVHVELELIDLRQNDIDSDIEELINSQLTSNRAGREIEYNLGPLWNYNANHLKTVPKRKIIKSKMLKKFSPPIVRFPRKAFKSLQNAIKISYSIISDDAVIQRDAASQTESDFVEHIKRISRALTQEMTMRHVVVQLLKKTKNENVLLRKELEKLSKQEDLIFIDNETFLEVKQTFEKFKRFLGIMKEYGLWEFIAILGVNENADMILEPVFNESTKQMKVVEKTSNENISLCDNSSAGDSLQARAPLPLPVKQRCCCNCRKPECKPKVSRELPDPKADARKVFKEVQENYSNSCNHPPKVTHKMHSNHFKNSVMKKLYKVDVPSKLKQFKSPKDLYDAVRQDMEKCDKCKSEHGATACSSKATISVSSRNPALRNVSSQTPHVTQVINLKTTITSKSSTVESQLSTKSDSKTGTSSKNSAVSSGISEDLISSLNTGQRAPIQLIRENKGASKIKAGNVSKSAASSSTDVSGRPISIENLHAALYESLKEPESSKSSKKNIDVKNAISNLTSKESLESYLSAKSQELSIKMAELNSKVENSSVGSFERLSSKGGSKSAVSCSEVNHSSKSYLESVSDASTDRDVKTISESEIYNSADNKSDSKTGKEASKSSSKNSIPNKTNQVQGKSESFKEISNHSKSSKKSRSQKKSAGGSSGKTVKKVASDSSVPSLSDITTVSSHSLNTDSVMGKLSDG